MRRRLPADAIARDERFVMRGFGDLIADDRGRSQGRGVRVDMHDGTGPDSCRELVHRVFVGELESLETSGRTLWECEGAPFELRLALARQCWDEARHCAIAARLLEWTGVEISDQPEYTVFHDVAAGKPLLYRLVGTNRCLEGLAIDVFNALRDASATVGDPVMAYCEDWMLADEVTHVRLGSDWLVRLTADDPVRRERALRFARSLSRLFARLSTGNP